MKKLLSLLLCLGLGFGFNSCKDDEDTDDGPSTPSKVEIPKIVTSISASHPDPNANSVKTQVESLSAFGFEELYSSFLSTFGSIPWQKSGNVYTYSLISGGIGFKYEITENPTNSVFRYYYSGELNHVMVNNALVYEFTYAHDGKSGSITSFNFTESNASYAAYSYSWSTSGSGVISVEMTLKDSAIDALLTKYTVHLSSNKSGDAEWVINGVKTWTATWAADGSGEQKYYSGTGEVTQTYPWTKNP